MSAEPHTPDLPNGEEGSFAKEQEMEALRLEVESLRRQIAQQERGAEVPIRLLWAWAKAERALREYDDAVMSATPREPERYRMIIQLAPPLERKDTPCPLLTWPRWTGSSPMG
jgi:predicted kinase